MMIYRSIPCQPYLQLYVHYFALNHVVTILDVNGNICYTTNLFTIVVDCLVLPSKILISCIIQLSTVLAHHCDGSDLGLLTSTTSFESLPDDIVATKL